MGTGARSGRQTAGQLKGRGRRDAISTGYDRVSPKGANRCINRNQHIRTNPKWSQLSFFSQ